MGMAPSPSFLQYKTKSSLHNHHHQHNQHRHHDHHQYHLLAKKALVISRTGPLPVEILRLSVLLGFPQKLPNLAKEMFFSISDFLECSMYGQWNVCLDWHIYPLSTFLKVFSCGRLRLISFLSGLISCSTLSTWWRYCKATHCMRWKLCWDIRENWVEILKTYLFSF